MTISADLVHPVRLDQAPMTGFLCRCWQMARSAPCSLWAGECPIPTGRDDWTQATDVVCRESTGSRCFRMVGQDALEVTISCSDDDIQT